MSRPEIIDTPAGPALLKRSHRKTLAISVLPDGALELIAPAEAPIEAILPRVTKRLAWIKSQRRAFFEMNATRPALRYVNGATHRYLGRQYRLKVTRGAPPEVSLRGGYFHISLPKMEEDEVKAALSQWYRRQSRQQFERRVQAWADWCHNRRLPPPTLRLRQMSKRWGSALRDGTIYLNPDLIRAPSSCIDYVITHEVCHLMHPNHGRHFWALLSQLMPDWKKRKARLESTDL